MMTSAKFLFYLTGLFLGEIVQTRSLKSSSSVHQDRHFISVKIGDSVTLHCSSKSEGAPRFYWYKQTLGEKPRLISTFYKYEKNTFHNEFKSDPRFTLDTETGQNHLIISDLRISDSATYFCICSYLHTSTFSESITVSVKDSDLNIKVLVEQSASEAIQPGGSVTLNCTVHTGTCDGEHSVYWFKDSEESHPGLIYTHGGRNDQCVRKPNTHTQSCFYNLTMSLNLSHAGTYYCAVASCGHILFGNGTKLDFASEGDCCVSVYLLSGELAFTTFLSLLMAFLLYMTHKRNSSKFTESLSRCSLPSSTNAEDYRSILTRTKTNRSRRQQDDTWTECVYFTVKQ